jgi:hypothetical protein
MMRGTKKKNEEGYMKMQNMMIFQSRYVYLVAMIVGKWRRDPRDAIMGWRDFCLYPDFYKEAATCTHGVMKAQLPSEKKT